MQEEFSTKHQRNEMNSDQGSVLRAQRLIILQTWEDGYLALRMLRQLLQEMRLDPEISPFDAQYDANTSMPLCNKEMFFVYIHIDCIYIIHSVYIMSV